LKVIFYSFSGGAVLEIPITTPRSRILLGQ